MNLLSFYELQNISFPPLIESLGIFCFLLKISFLLLDNEPLKKFQYYHKSMMMLKGTRMKINQRVPYLTYLKLLGYCSSFANKWKSKIHAVKPISRSHTQVSYEFSHIARKYTSNQIQKSFGIVDHFQWCSWEGICVNDKREMRVL